MKSLIWVLMLAGCVNLGGETRPSTTYVLLDTHSTTAASAQQSQTLMVAPIRTSSFDDNDKLVFARTANTRAVYQLARWSERPSSRLNELLFSRLSNSRVYANIVPDDSDVIADRLLTADLLSFYHDASTQPGQVNVRMRVTLYDNLQHILIAQRVFEQDVVVKTYDAAGAATAFNLATTALLDDVVNWLAQPIVTHSH
jgi:cholesterol transport system auxiliary component